MGNPPERGVLAGFPRRSLHSATCPREEDSDVADPSNAHTVLVALGWWIRGPHGVGRYFFHMKYSC
jgi:hypothetical protein